MLRLLAMEEIQALEGGVPELVRLYERKESNFATAVKDWLRQAEQLLTNSRLPGAGEVAGLRGMLISAEQGVIPDNLHFKGAVSLRRIRNATAAEVLRKAERRLGEGIAPTVAQVAEADRLVRQMLPVARRKGLAPLMEMPGSADQLVALWRALESDADLGAIATHVVGLVGKQDALIVLDRCLV